MATNLENKINRIKSNVSAAFTKIAAKGVSVPTGANSDELPGLIEQISQAEDLDAVLDEQEAKLNALLESLDGKVAAGGSGGGVETCTVTIAGYPETSYAYYSNGTEVVHYDDMLLPGDEFTVAKNSIFYIRLNGSTNYDEGNVGLTNGRVLSPIMSNTYLLIAIYGDCTITL